MFRQDPDLAGLTQLRDLQVMPADVLKTLDATDHVGSTGLPRAEMEPGECLLNEDVGSNL